MNKFLRSVFLLLFPILAMADDSLSFTPPASDYSVVFLGNIFGIVDGVLHGTGSQIMGSMFAVFNAAVLALGGIIIMYTLLVSTMNTAHEGQMLGQKWSSIWIPVRSTIGLALLIPKASGYCLMQIFIMWTVVQGVGAADKVWNAALSYLNRGGVIIQGQMDPTKALLSAATSGVAGGAKFMLAGQVCMLGLEKQLQNTLRSYKMRQSSNGGPCSGTPSPSMAAFCSSTVPSFSDTIDFVSVQKNYPANQTFEMPMPNFPTTSPTYFFLNGLCGTIRWNRFPDLSALPTKIAGVTASDVETASYSRAIAIQQVFLDMTAVAQSMVSNNPNLGTPVPPDPANPNFSPTAEQQYGVPHSVTGSICDDNNTLQCILWGPLTDGSVLLNGTELQDAVADYDGIMLPTLNLVLQANNAEAASNSRKFINDATTEGWIMAGSYFFNLINLNVQASANGGQTDSETGLDRSDLDIRVLANTFGSGSNLQCLGNYKTLCEWFNTDVGQISPIVQMINGAGLINPVVPKDTNLGKDRKVVSGLGSSTVYGYVVNASILKLPGQPGMNPQNFGNMLHITVNTDAYQLPEADFPCGQIRIMFFATCLGGMFGELLYNGILRVVYNFILQIGSLMVNEALTAFLITPMQGMATIFQYGLTLISMPGVNPVVGLAQMGTYYINFVSNLWIQLLTEAIVSALFPVIGIFIFALMGIVLPLLMAWLGIMVAIGITTAYYVPILPYMIFTFGTIAWLMAVIEAMVAGPIVALGVTHPEGHDAFGKGEQAIMILLNVFLRPAMMIIGYIAGIALSYVSVWILNAGFSHAIGFMQGSNEFGTNGYEVAAATGAVSGGYTGWAGMYAFFFAILIYTSMYLTVVQKAFTLITVLPDKILRWIGGQPESYGSDAAQWGEETKGKISEAGKDTISAQGQMSKNITGKVTEAVSKAKGGKGGGAGGKGSGGGGGGGAGAAEASG